MNRRPDPVRRMLLRLAAAAGTMAATIPGRAQPPPASGVPGEAASRPLAGAKPQIAMLVHPDMILLDLVGPQTVFAILGADIHLVWRDRTPVRSDVGLMVQPTVSFADCPADLDVLFVPGGLKGSVEQMGASDTLAFLADRGGRARYVTSVCTGSLVLGAAGLLRGFRATSHWYVRHLLARMGATPTAERVVVDRNRVTGGGVTAGLDFGLALAALLGSEEAARRIQLVLEYDPHPPFHAGSPDGAGPDLTTDVLRRRAPALADAAHAADAAAQRLGT